MAKGLYEEVQEYKSYLAFLRFLKIPYPIPDNLRPVLEARIKREYELIQKKESELSAQFRKVISRIVEEHIARQAEKEKIECTPFK